MADAAKDCADARANVFDRFNGLGHYTAGKFNHPTSRFRESILEGRIPFNFLQCLNRLKFAYPHAKHVHSGHGELTGLRLDHEPAKIALNLDGLLNRVARSTKECLRSQFNARQCWCHLWTIIVLSMNDPGCCEHKEER